MSSPESEGPLAASLRCWRWTSLPRATIPRCRPQGRWQRAGLLALALLAVSPVRADQQELYTVIGYAPGVSHFDLPANGSGSTTSFAGAIDLSAYYGLTNKLHVGGRIRGSSSTDVRFAAATLTLPGGEQSSGDVYQNHRSLGLAALAHYRLDTWPRLAPAFEVEAGFTSHQYRRIEHMPAGVTYTIELPDISETVLHGAVALLLEYRLGNRWVAAIGLSLRGEAGGFTPWTLGVPLRVGVIW